MAEEVKIAIIGCGYWGKNLIRNFNDNESCSIKYCCDINKKRLSLVARQFPGIVCLEKPDSVFEDPEVTAVVISTPIHTHYPLAKKALECGKHLLVEKPLTDNLEKAIELHEVASKRKRILCVDHTFLYSPAVNMIRDLLHKEELGNLYFANMMRVNLGIHSSDANVLWDLAPHDISILLHWLKEKPEKISVTGRACARRDLVDLAYLNLQYPSGFIANLNVSWLSPRKLRNIVLVGSRKTLTYDDAKPDSKIKIFNWGITFNEPKDFGEYQLTYGSGDVVSPFVQNYEPLSRLTSHFIECIKEEKQPHSDSSEAIQVIKIIHHAEQSLLNGGLPVSIRW